MNPYIDKEGYLCIQEQVYKFDIYTTDVHITEGNKTYVDDCDRIFIKITKRYKVNTTTGLFEEVTN